MIRGGSGEQAPSGCYIGICIFRYPNPPQILLGRIRGVSWEDPWEDPKKALWGCYRGFFLFPPHPVFGSSTDHPIILHRSGSSKNNPRILYWVDFERISGGSREDLRRISSGSWEYLERIQYAFNFYTCDDIPDTSIHNYRSTTICF